MTATHYLVWQATVKLIEQPTRHSGIQERFVASPVVVVPVKASVIAPSQATMPDGSVVRVWFRPQQPTSDAATEMMYDWNFDAARWLIAWELKGDNLQRFFHYSGMTGIMFDKTLNDMDTISVRGGHRVAGSNKLTRRTLEPEPVVDYVASSELSFAGGYLTPDQFAKSPYAGVMPHDGN